jgi:hypothetical protein
MVDVPLGGVETIAEGSGKFEKAVEPLGEDPKLEVRNPKQI